MFTKKEALLTIGVTTLIFTIILTLSSVLFFPSGEKLVGDAYISLENTQQDNFWSCWNKNCHGHYTIKDSLLQQCSRNCLTLARTPNSSRRASATNEPLQETVAQLIASDNNHINIDIISLKDYPQLIKSGELFNLAGSSLIFTRIDNNSYSWKKVPLEWKEDYGTDKISLPFGSPLGTTSWINLPFSFPFYSEEKDGFYISTDLSLILKDETTSDQICLPMENKFAGCKAKIVPLGRFMSDATTAHLKYGLDNVLITFTTDKPALDGIEIQVEVKSQGDIKISYKRVDHPALGTFAIGLIAGADKPYTSPDFNNNMGGSIEVNMPTSMIKAYSAPILDDEIFQNLIYTNYSDKYFDEVFATTDFTHIVGAIGTFGGSLSALSHVFYNDVEGTGFWLSNCENCEVDKHVKAIVYTNNLMKYDLNYSDTNNKLNHLLLHEFLHKWAAFIHATSPQQVCVDTNETTAACHWLINLPAADDNDCSSALLQNSQIATCYGYSWLDLYLMGLADANEVMDYDVSAIIIEQGERIPSFQTSQKEFNILPVIITQKSKAEFLANEQEFINLYKNYLIEFIKNYHKVTLQRGTILTNDQGSPPHVLFDQNTIPNLKNEDLSLYIADLLRSKSLNVDFKNKVYKTLPMSVQADICKFKGCDFSTMSKNLVDDIGKMSSKEEEDTKEKLLLLSKERFYQQEYKNSLQIIE